MTTRTVKMFGLAYGSSPAEITVTLDGASVYTGTVSTIDTPVPNMPDPDLVGTTVEFCTFELPIDFAGTKPMTCLVTNGTVLFAQITANYSVSVNANTDPVIGTGQYGYKGINSIGDVISDARSNVAIDGIAQPINHNEMPGTWWFKISTGSTLSYDLVVQAGTANVAPPAP